jgi:hypothetical protein
MLLRPGKSMSLFAGSKIRHDLRKGRSEKLFRPRHVPFYQREVENQTALMNMTIRRRIPIDNGRKFRLGVVKLWYLHDPIVPPQEDSCVGRQSICRSIDDKVGSQVLHNVRGDLRKQRNRDIDLFITKPYVLAAQC